MNTIDLLQLTQDQKTEGIWLSGICGEGEYLIWYFNEQLHIKALYKNGKSNGECLEWRNNGQLWEKTFYKNGKLHGERLIWYEDGQLWEKAFYENGIKISYEHH